MHREKVSKRLARLDNYVVKLGLVVSRSRAQDLIRRGLVEVGGVLETRPAASPG